MADAKKLQRGMPFEIIGAPSLANFTMNDPGDKLVVIFQAESADPITTLLFRQGSVSGTAPAYRASIQGVTTGGIEDGTVKGGGSPASGTFTPTAGGNSTAFAVALANAYTPSRGEVFAVVLEWSSGTINGANSCSFAGGIGNTNSRGLPKAIQFDATGSVRTLFTNFPACGYRTASGSFGFPLAAATTLNMTAVEWAAKFTVPTNFGGSDKVMGIRFAAAMPAADSLVINLYQGGLTTDKTVLQTVTLDSDLASSTNQGLHTALFTDATLATLTTGSTYRIGLIPQSGGTFTLPYIDVLASGDLSAYPGGTDFSASNRTGSGDWTDTATRRLFLEIFLSDLSPPASTNWFRGGDGWNGGMNG